MKMSVLPTALSKVGVIGSAGRKGDAKKMTKAIFDGMVAKTEEVITNHFKLDLSQVHLVSGGAAWADHIAVVEYLHDKVAKLTLHLPTKWHADDTNPHFDDNMNTNIWKNPGRSANKLHKQFSTKMGEDTLKHLYSAALMGARFHEHDGFKARNTAVAAGSRYLIAFTWGEGSSPKEESGTHDTWSKHRGKKIHIPIGSLPQAQSTAKQAQSTAKRVTKQAVKSTPVSSNVNSSGTCGVGTGKSHLCVDSGFSSQSSSELEDLYSNPDWLPSFESQESPISRTCGKRDGGSLDSAGEPITSPKKQKLA